ncbi:hypothetical protein [Glutamicibacter sp. NPDC087344]|uniref:hypothetical protein n=1 Tax=Glutamicibacter sp. NPDC087344 TaxID=3363994 RepID=UPI0037FE2BA8
MVKKKSEVLVRPIRSAKISQRLVIEHSDYPKSDRIHKAVKAVELWARAYPAYRGKVVLVEAGSLADKDQSEGLGRLNIDSVTVSHFSVIALEGQ